MRSFLLLVGVVLFTSCSNVLEKPMNAKDLPEVKEAINNDESFSPMKKKYLVDNISELTGWMEMGKAVNPDADTDGIPTFEEEIADFSADFDSIRGVKLLAIENNKKLKDFVRLKDAKTYSIDKYKGHLGLTLDFNNQFDKDILYIILNYKYINKYDTRFFDESSKLTDEVAGDFKGELEISTTEEYNDVADFMYSKVPVQAPKSLREELGEEEANRKVERDFLLEGLQVTPTLIVFKDKSELSYQDADWEYMEESEIASVE